MPVRTALTVEVRDGHVCVFMPPTEELADYLDLLAVIEFDRGCARSAGSRRRLCAAARSAAQCAEGDARSRRHRGQHPAGDVVARGRRDHAGGLRGRPSLAARHRQIHDRRPPHRHRRRQSRRARRPEPGRQPVSAPARSAEESRPLCAAAAVAVLSVFADCSSARPARRRASTRRARICSTSSKSPSARCRRRAPTTGCRRGWSTGCSATSWSTSPATPIAPRSASTNCFRPTARPAGWDWSNSARSKCRRMRA